MIRFCLLHLVVLPGLLAVIAPDASGDDAASSPVAAVPAVWEAYESDDYDRALKLIDEAEKAARRDRDEARLAITGALQKHVKAVEREYLKRRGAFATLAESSGDAAASATVGVFYCLVKGDWETGLPLLAAGDDDALAAAAKLGLAGPSTVEDQRAVADAWHAAAEGVHHTLRPAVLDHAIAWDVRALGEVERDQREALERRVWKVLESRVGRDGSVEVDTLAVTRELNPEQLEIASGLRFGNLQLGSDWGPSTKRAGTYIHVFGEVHNASSQGQITEPILATANLLCVNGDGERRVVRFGGSIDVATRGTQEWSTASASKAYTERMRHHNSGNWLPHQTHVRVTMGGVTIHESFLGRPDPRYGVWWLDDGLLAE